MSVAEYLLIVAAGFAAGLVGFITGLASLLSYPALLLIGLPPVAANVTNTVAMVAVGAGSVTNSAAELARNKGHTAVVGVLGLVGGAIGAGVLLVAPPGVFAATVPVLVAGASVALVLAPRLRERARERPMNWAYPIGVVLISVYGGYFGAGAGVMILALILVCTAEPLWRAAVLKSYVLGIAKLAAAIGFAVFGPVHWPAAIAMAIGGFAGGWCGPPVVKRLNPDWVRWVVGVGGLGLAAWLARVWF